MVTATEVSHVCLEQGMGNGMTLSGTVSAIYDG